MAQVVLTNARVQGDTVTATGTVDGQQVTVTLWKSDLMALGTKAAKAAFVAQAMRDQVQPPAPNVVDLSGTYTV